MKGYAFLIAVCTLLFIEFSVTYGQDEEDCPYNEVDVDCVSGCNTCEFANKTCPTPDDCEPGCDCKDGYLRNKFGYCIPHRYCGASKLPEEPPVEGGREVGDSGGCPNSELCILSCKRRNFATGICLGPQLGYCNCYTPVSVPAGQEPPGNGEVSDSGGCPDASICKLSCKRRGFATGLCLGPRSGYCYNPIKVPAGHEPPGNGEVAQSGGCPDATICTLSCKRRGFATGLCLGPRSGYCNCYTPIPVPDGQETPGKRDVAQSGGCPDATICTLSCKRRGFATGLCLGPRTGYCNCYTSTRVPAEGRREVANSGGCPNTLNCIRSCNRRNFETGVCLGPRRGYCNCYSSSNSRNHGCPQRSLCVASCKRRRFSTGICVGDRRLDCKCSGKLD